MSAHEGHFAALAASMAGVGTGVPRLLIDLDRVDANIERLLEVRDAESVRIVTKSLPSRELLTYVTRRIGHQRLMVFHLPFLLQVVADFPKADVLLGKPMPIAAMREFYRHRIDNAFDDERQLHWIADTPARLVQIGDLAGRFKRRISVSIELDVGLHRGGVVNTRALVTMLETVRDRRHAIHLSGFMGYDAHVPKAPWPLSVQSAHARVVERYGEFVARARQDFPDLEEDPWTLNGAGSPTIALHDTSSPLNDFSIGSALVKPTDFDVRTLDGFEPAAWIATPVLKRLRGVNVPFIEKLPSRGRDTLFIYGGKWMARPVSPDGLRDNPAYGTSSNQQMFTIPADSPLTVDDWVFLRPTQSEAVLLQFGDLCVIQNGRHVGDWAVYAQTVPHFGSET